MSTDRDTERIALSWLRADEHVSADRLLDDVLRTVDTTPQRQPSWLARRTPTMNNTVRLFAAAAAVVVAALIGYQLLLAPKVGGPGPAASPSPESSTTPSPAPSGGTGWSEVQPGALDPGTYRATEFPNGDSDITIQFTVPSGWTWNDWYLSQGAGTGPPGGVGVGFMTGMEQEDFLVYTDPCSWSESEPDPPTGPTAEDFIRALATQPGRNATEPTERRGNQLEGPGTWPGWTVTIEVPEDAVFSECDGRQYRSWGPEPNERFHQGPGQRDTVWAIEQPAAPIRLVVFATSFPDTSADALSEMEAIVDSIVTTDTH